MSSTDSYGRKTCKSCLEDVTIHVTCSKCAATYHIYCVKNVPGAYANTRGQLFCCRNITSNHGGNRNILRTQDDPLEKVTEKESLDECEEDLESYELETSVSSDDTNNEHLEDHYGECCNNREGSIQEFRIKDEDSENCSPDKEDSEQNKLTCESCYLEFTNKEHLEGHYSECPFIIQGGFIQDINRNKELENYPHKEEDLERDEFKCSACVLQFINKQHLDDHYKECPNKQTVLLPELYEDKELENCPHKEEDLEQDEFKCSACVLQFINKQHLDDHYKECPNIQTVLLPELYEDKELENCLHKEEDLEQNEFKCSACLLEFINKQHLDNHCKECPNKQTGLLPELYGDKVGLVCSFCNEENFQDEPYEQHIKRCEEEYHSGLNEVNNVGTTSVERKEAHLRTNERLFRCDKCGYATKRRHFLKYHTLLKHYDRMKRSAHIQYTLEKHLRSYANQSFKCNRCDYRTALKGSLKNHVKVKHSNAEKKYKCCKCKYSTCEKRNLVNHIYTHLNGGLFTCDSCDYITTRRTHFMRHVRTHTEKERFQCDTCEYAATSKSGLNRHILENHSNVERKYKCDAFEKKYKCSDCKYSTHKKSNLVKHIRTHTNEKPFKCDNCNYATNWGANLNHHILFKHFNAEKMYKCSDCPYSAHRKAHLVEHSRIHTNEKPFKCDTCDYATPWKKSLNSHILNKHSDAEKMYKCGVCKYSAHEKHKLVRHTLIHTKGRPVRSKRKV